MSVVCDDTVYALMFRHTMVRSKPFIIGCNKRHCEQDGWGQWPFRIYGRIIGGTRVWRLWAVSLTAELLRNMKWLPSTGQCDSSVWRSRPQGCTQIDCEQIHSSINQQLIAGCFGHEGLRQLCTNLKNMVWDLSHCALTNQWDLSFLYAADECLRSRNVLQSVVDWYRHVIAHNQYAYIEEHSNESQQRCPQGCLDTHIWQRMCLLHLWCNGYEGDAVLVDWEELGVLGHLPHAIQSNAFSA